MLDLPPFSTPLTAASLTARSTLFTVSLTVSIAVLLWIGVVEKRREVETAEGRATTRLRRAGREW